MASSFECQIQSELQSLKDDLQNARLQIDGLKESVAFLMKGKSCGNSSTERVRNRRTRNPEKAISSILARTAELQDDRNAILAFNRMNDERPDDEKLRWSETTTNTKGVETTKTFSRVDGNTSLLALVKSEHKSVLEKSGEKDVTITSNIIKKYRVIYKDGKLIPLSNDFRDGIGAEYLWMDDDYMENVALATRWKNPRKKATDPRIGMIDPSTGEVWKMESDDSNRHSHGGKVMLFKEDSSEEDDSSDEEEEEEEESKYVIGKGKRGKELMLREDVEYESDSSKRSRSS